MSDNKIYPFPNYPDKDEAHLNYDQSDFIQDDIDNYYDEDEYLNYRSHNSNYESEYYD